MNKLMILDNPLMNALEDLQKQGYTCKFYKNNDYLYCTERDMNFRSYELNISETFRYENKEEPFRNGILYAIESPEYGLKGLAKILGCSVSKASEIKSSGILDEAIIQNGNIIIIDKEKALQLFAKK